MELDGSRQETLGDFLVHVQRAGHEGVAGLLDDDGERRAGQMLRQDRRVDELKSVAAGKAEREDAEVALESRVDGEAAGRRVHARYVLRIVDLLEGQLVAVVPVAVVEVLTYQSVWLDRIESVYLLTNIG